MLTYAIWCWIYDSRSWAKTPRTVDALKALIREREMLKALIREREMLKALIRERDTVDAEASYQGRYMLLASWPRSLLASTSKAVLVARTEGMALLATSSTTRNIFGHAMTVYAFLTCSPTIFAEILFFRFSNFS
jgi:hypothetical protein